MKYVRFVRNGTIQHGIVNRDRVDVIEGGPFDAPVQIVSRISSKDIKLIAPLAPSKIIAIGLNYKDHAKELNLDLPEEPLIFLKPPSSVIGPNDVIYYPKQTKRLDYEAEMAVVMKKKARNIAYEEAEDYIFGYTCLNDVTARDLQKKDGQWTRAKSFDTFCPIGPCIETEIDASSLKIELLVNKEVKQSSNTSEMIFNSKRLLEFISRIMTLLPGDIIATGTPAGVGPLNAGDEVEVKIEKIGSLVNRVGRV